MEYIQLKEQVKQELPVNVEIEEEDNLLELGLDSLKIMRLVNTWRKQGIRIPYGHLMEQPTLKTLVAVDSKKNEEKRKTKTPSGTADILQKGDSTALKREADHSKTNREKPVRLQRWENICGIIYKMNRERFRDCPLILLEKPAFNCIQK